MTDVQICESVAAPSMPAIQQRSARWVPWALLAAEIVITGVVIGVLSLMVMGQLALTPQAMGTEFDDLLNLVVGLGFTAAVWVIAAAVLFVVTGLLVAILGAPIRLIGSWRRAWLGNGEVTIAGVVVGLLALIAAYVFGDRASFDGQYSTYEYYVPNLWLLLVGWFTLALSLSLLVWPVRWLPRRARLWWVETQLTKSITADS